MSEPIVEAATWADAPAIRTLLAHAFRENPLVTWVLPDAGTRLDASAAWMGASMDRYLASGVVDVARLDGTVVGVAAWRPPGSPAEPPPTLPSPVGVLGLVVGPDRAQEVVTMLSTSVARFAPERASTYLNFLAVQPEHQGRGLGRLLLDVGVARARRDGFGTYLATSDPRNVPFYELAGFHRVGSTDLGGPVLRVLHGSD
jgi:predicted N-acetyltransferase YhbS